jgi:hypothetical protein
MMGLVRGFPSRASRLAVHRAAKKVNDLAGMLVGLGKAVFELCKLGVPGCRASEPGPLRL